MERERWYQVKLIFEQASELPYDERPAFLDAACAGDTALREEVASLLAADQNATGFLETPAVIESAAPPEQADGQDRVGEQIGSYRLVRELGRGGMGTVYLAERADGQYQQNVALKLVRRGLDTDDILSRFRYERQILASLDHPHIARLYDGGMTEDGRPYFVMEYVEGLPVTDYCDRHRLSTRQRLALFRTVCRAVQYAHQNLVVHRDLKPSNILVTEDGTAKLLDFGIAKLLDEEALDQIVPHTRTGLRLMTPEYASPEQIKGEPITTATDVYQLGVLLYELLTGHRPYRLPERMQYEIERVILEEEPTRPSLAVRQTEERRHGSTTDSITPEIVSQARSTNVEDLQRRLSGDLDTIVLTALKKDQARRYASVDQLAEDIRRHLSGLPVTARKDTFGYRASKFVQRHKMGVAATALVVLALVGGVAATVWQAGVAAAERNRARAEAAKSERINAFLQDMLSAADPYEGDRELTVADMLEAAARRAASELADQPDVEAAVRRTIGYTYLSLGRYDEAAVQLERALEIRTRLFDEDNPDVTESLYHIALLRYYQARYEEADSLYRRVITLSRARSRNPEPLLAVILNDYGLLLMDRGDYEAAAPVFRESLVIRRRTVKGDDYDVASTINNLALAHDWLGRTETAGLLYREALTMFRKTVGDEHPDVAAVLNNLAFVVRAQGDSAEASSLWRESLAMRRRLFGNTHPNVVVALANLGAQLRLEGSYAEAETYLREALSVSGATLPAHHPHVGSIHTNLGWLLTDQGRLPEAEAHFREALAIYGETLPADHQSMAGAEEGLGTCLVAQKHYAEAEPLLLHNYAVVSGRLGPSHDEVRSALRHLVALYEAWDQPDRAAPYRARLAASGDP